MSDRLRNFEHIPLDGGPWRTPSRLRSGEERSHHRSRCAVALFENVTVDPERERRVGVTEPTGDGANVDVDVDVDKAGVVSLRYKSQLHHIGIGRPYAGWRVILLVNGLEVRVFGLDGSPLRHLRLDPSKDYQPQP